jgi:hypothetical protein
MDESRGAANCSLNMKKERNRTGKNKSADQWKNNEFTVKWLASCSGRRQKEQQMVLTEVKAR